MTPQEQLDYALGQIDDAERNRFDEEIGGNPSLDASLTRLRRHLDLLLDDGEGPAPPADLVRRTIMRVELERRRRTILEFIPSRVRTRWADVAVAAGILVAGLLTLLPAVQRSQLAARSAACAANLRQLGVGLIRYSTVHNAFPYPEPGATAPYAGTFALHLNEMGLLDDVGLLDCPSNGRNPLPRCLPCFAEFEAMERARPASAPCLRHCDYAYSLGFRHDGAGNPLTGMLPSDFPLLSDQPPHDERGHALDGNSENHFGAGQYVLFVGGNVRFVPDRRVGPDADLFRNQQEETAPGLDPSDYVLAPGITRVYGH